MVEIMTRDIAGSELKEVVNKLYVPFARHHHSHFVRLFQNTKQHRSRNRKDLSWNLSITKRHDSKSESDQETEIRW